MNELNKKLWLETLRDYCHCVPDAVGNMPCDNGMLCDRCCEPDVFAVYSAKVEAAERKQLSNFQKLQDLFTKDLQEVLDYMSHNDPNGEYSMADMLLAPMDFIEVLEQWKEDLGYESTEKERIKIDELISILYVVELAKNAE